MQETWMLDLQRHLVPTTVLPVQDANGTNQINGGQKKSPATLPEADRRL